MPPRDGYWVELADGVLARRYAELDLTVGLVLGAERACVIDTRGDHAQGAELAAAVGARTPLPVTVAITHAHFDHCFGTRAFTPTEVWAHRGCATTLTATAERQRAEWYERYARRGDAATAAALAATEVIPPTALVGDEPRTLDLGGRHVTLRHPGAGHTDHDLVVEVPDAGVVFAGDLVEQGAPPDFSDAVPAAWPGTLDALLAAGPTTVVPGHGDPVDAAFVRTQRAELAAVAELCRATRAGELDERGALAASPYPAETTRAALAASRGLTANRGLAAAMWLYRG